MIVEHYERFDIIFHFKAAQNLVAEHYERDFDMIFHLMKEVKEIRLTGPALMMINKTRFSLDYANSVRDNFTGKNVRRLNLLLE